MGSPIRKNHSSVTLHWRKKNANAFLGSFHERTILLCLSATSMTIASVKNFFWTLQMDPGWCHIYLTVWLAQMDQDLPTHGKILSTYNKRTKGGSWVPLLAHQLHPKGGRRKTIFLAGILFIVGCVLRKYLIGVNFLKC